jgi:hexosaminidase
VLAVRAPWPGHAEVVADLVAALSEHGLAPRRRDDEPTAAVQLAVDPALGLPKGGYRLEVGAAGVRMVGVDGDGARYAVATLRQWLEVHPVVAAGELAAGEWVAGEGSTTVVFAGKAHAGNGEPLAGEAPAGSGPTTGGVQGLVVTDWPGLAERGYLLDVSRDRVPTMASLRALVAVLARLKLNQLQLYVEHTFAYAGHEMVWQDASPFTADEIRELDALCRRHGIALVANQNSLGHLHRWLRHPAYRRFAECPQGVSHPFGDEIEPFSLCPSDPAVLELLAGWYDQLLPCFASRTVNAGLDETFDLGLGRSAERVAAVGRARVYLDHLLAVHRLLAEHGCRMQVWGDVVLEHPELIAELPGDLTALVWGYEQRHPFAEQAQRFAEAGISYLLCPGTSTWASFAGRTENALRNLASAARTAAATGAAGVLVTDWGDFGHLQPPAASWGPLVAGAGWAWNPAAAPAADEPLDLGRVARAVNGVVWRQATAGLARAALELGNVYRRTGTPNINGTALFHLLLRAGQDLSHGRYRGLSAAGLTGVVGALEEILGRLGAMPVQGDEAALGREELQWAGELLLVAAELARVRLAAGETAPVADLRAAARARLARALLPLCEAHRPLWLRRSRSGGQQDSAARLWRVADLLRGHRQVGATAGR